MQQAINRAFNILECVSTNPDKPSSFIEIAESTGLNSGTCANIIKAMVERGYLEKLDDKKGYLLGKKLYQLTNFEGYKKDLLKLSRPVLEGLTEKINENVLIAVMNGSSRIVLLQTKSNQDLQATSAIDKHAYDSASGRLLIAMMTDEESGKFVSKYGLPTAAQWKEASTQKGLQKAIEKIRKDGYAVQESQRHITGIALAVTQAGKTIASVGVFMPTFRYEALNKTAFIKEIKIAADKISGLL